MADEILKDFEFQNLEKSNPEIFEKLQSAIPLLYVVSDDDHKFLRELQATYYSGDSKEREIAIFHHSTTFGMVELDEYFNKFTNMDASPKDKSKIGIHDTMIKIFEDKKSIDSTSKKIFRHIYIISEADQHMERDAQFVKRTLDFCMQHVVSDFQYKTKEFNKHLAKTIIFLSSNMLLNLKLQHQCDVVYYNLPDYGEIQEVVEFYAGIFADNFYAAKDALLSRKSSSFKDIKKTDTAQDIKKKFFDSTKDGDLVRAMQGLTLYQAGKICCEVFRKAKNLRGENYKIVLDFKKEALKKTNLISTLDVPESFDDVGGLNKLKSWFKSMSGGWTQKGIDFGLPILKGCLLVGVPGTGKSLICKALGAEYNLPVINFDPSKLFSSRVGESEANAHKTFKMIEAQSPCILFIDEIEKGFAGSQSSTFSDAGTTARVIGSFLQWMQNCEKFVFTIATSNMIEYLPPELVSRFDEVFFVNLPNQQERETIFEIQIRKVKRDVNKFDLKALSESSKNLTGREIEQVVREGMYLAYSRNIDLTSKILLEAVNNKIPVIKTMERSLKFLIDWVGWDEHKKDGIRARFASGGKMEFNDLEKLMEEIQDVANKGEEENGGKESSQQGKNK